MGIPTHVNGTYQIGYWSSAPGSSVASSLATLLNQFHQYLTNGFGSSQGIADTALKYLEDTITTSNASNTASLARGPAIAGAALPKGLPGQWSVAAQQNLTASLGSVINGWVDLAQGQLYRLFNGTQSSVNLLTNLIANGYFVDGVDGAPSADYNNTSQRTDDMKSLIGKVVFGFSIPVAWTLSGSSAFVLDSGYSCGTQNPLTQYVTNSTQEATYACFNNKLYYLVYPDGDWKACASDGTAKIDSINCVDCDPPPPFKCSPTYFTAPPGLDSLDGVNWDGITLSDLIGGAVNTYIANGNSNGGTFPDPMDQQTFQDLTNQDITTPGYIRLPVCSAQVAWASWSNPSQSNATAPNYPCNPLQGVTKCSDFTFVDQTSSASPKATDCETIIKNIQNTDGQWTTGIGSSRDIASYGSCNFDVQNIGVTGDVTFDTGSQDIVYIITQSIEQFVSNGLVGAKGIMTCDGDAGSQQVEWVLY